ncbi:hypothetical protein RGCCGE502_31382 (plasmid) [Rhizobium grahamii CCGE 502]|uniref:Uncharacterized protein n=1 Tax=Rhizobium grahamii CCGE 502 TaxID=990285 RepID=S3HLM0_9HYPH|nr:hypothetical protein RGCCGE502_31382 [Rhizobium grahamii CCGE 502]
MAPTRPKRSPRILNSSRRRDCFRAATENYLIQIALSSLAGKEVPEATFVTHQERGIIIREFAAKMARGLPRAMVPG